jgi:hypothetical protein
LYYTEEEAAMSVENPPKRGPGSNQYKDQPPRPVDYHTLERNNNRSRNTKKGLSQLADRTPQEWADEYDRLVRKQTKIARDIDAVYEYMRTVEPMSNEYYDTLDRVEEMERDLEIAKQEIYESSLRAEGLTPTDVASGLHGRLTQQYFVLDEALEALNGAADGSAATDALWAVEGELTAARRDVLFLNRQGLLKGEDVNEFCDKASLHAAQLRRITSNGNAADVGSVREQVASIQASVSLLTHAAERISGAAK